MPLFIFFDKAKPLRCFLFAICMMFWHLSAVDLVIFSYDRPMQLYALLESCDLYVAGTSSKTVLYRVSSQDYQTGYGIVQASFPDVNFIKQQNAPYDFKKLVQKHAFEETGSNYIMFAVDDLFVKAPVNLLECISLLEEFRAYTFSLRLSPTISYCYLLNKQMQVPFASQISPGVYQHVFKKGQYDWAYPNHVDMNIYRKKDISQDILASNFDGPNQLEAAWAGRANLNQTGLYFQESKVVNIPLNQVQTAWNLRTMHSYSTKELLIRFMQGEKINLGPIKSLKNNSVHTAFEIDFIKR